MDEWTDVYRGGGDAEGIYIETPRHNGSMYRKGTCKIEHSNFCLVMFTSEHLYSNRICL